LILTFENVGPVNQNDFKIMQIVLPAS